MGAPISAKYESVDSVTTPSPSSVHLKTRTGTVEHNGVDWEAGKSQPGQPQPTGTASANMANDVLIQPDSETKDDLPSTEGHELDSFLGKAFEEKPIWRDLYDNIHDVFFPPKLPPLVLTSKPIPVPDRMAVKANPWAVGTSSLINLGILALVIWLGLSFLHPVVKPAVNVTNGDVSDILKAPVEMQPAGGGGGGGAGGNLDREKG